MEWMLRQECRMTGETNYVILSDQEKRWMESQAGFTGWKNGELEKLPIDHGNETREKTVD